MANLNSLQSGGYDPYDDVAICEEHDSDEYYEYLIDPRGDETVFPACKQEYTNPDELPF